MKLVKRILAGIDFRSDTEAVLETASTLAGRLGSEIALVHVLPAVSSWMPDEESGDARTLVELARTKCGEKLAEYGSRLKSKGLTVAEPAILEGTIFDQILAHADDLDSNVILVGMVSGESEQRRGPGITAERLCRKSSRPVWLVKPETKGTLGAILCPVDFSKPSERALRNAVFLARSFEASLTVLTVVPPVSALYGWLGRDKEAADAAQVDQYQRAFDAFLERFDFQGIPWNPLVRQGSPEQEILATAAESSTDLIVMGSVGRTGSSRILLGSVAEGVLQSASCSMLLVKSEDAFRLEISDQVADLESHFQEGRELLQQGFTEEARRRFQHCVSANVMFAPGWEALADCYERLGDAERAEECRAREKQIRDSLNWRRVEAEIRSQHPLWRRGGA